MAENQENTVTTLLREIPRDVFDEIDNRARMNFRSRNGEMLAILTAVTRGRVELPVSLYPGVATASGDDQDKPVAAIQGEDKADKRCRFTDANGYCTNEAMQGGGFKCMGPGCGGRVELEVGV